MKDIMSNKQTDIYTYNYCDTDYPTKLLDALKQLYISGMFTDVTLQCADSQQVFHCHKLLLSARSSYFEVMFTADMRERSDSTITLTGIDAAILGALVNYVYTAQVCITESNVQSLLEAADLLQFNSVKQACEEFLIRLLDADNCLGMHAFAQLHACPSLEREARRVTLSRFTELIEQEEFLELDHDRMKSLMAAQSLSMHRDEVLIDAVDKWVTYDLDNRLQHAADLLHSTYFNLDDAYFKAALEVHRKCLHSRTGKVKSLIIQSIKTSCKDKPANRNTSSMYIIGGYYWHPLCEVHIWDPVTNSWLQGKDMPDHARESYSVTLLGANIYVTGGYRTNTVEAVDTVSIYNCDFDEWTEGCPMITARYYHCSVALHGCIYAIGGYRGGAPEQETEFYDPLKKKWYPVAKLIQEYGLCSVSLENKLYLVGGQTTIADCYETDKDEWRQISVMKERRMECGAAVINGCIYVTGGYSYSRGTYLQSIEKYDPEVDSWEIVGTLPSPSRSHGCVCVYSV
ncbi:kelch-like protein 23 isoform X2 [Thalassophryne amazonica]|uniref:kelch-like protein 23 isoform X2 n=1 Tax=Thalassophryne amazonica TaxID=390379 RepID=UPI0014722146|nr:kelch-like protein 23 isoform X2 [Thalassophryne amazonica]